MSDLKSHRTSAVAALLLGWVIPGAGHAYAGRWGKAALFFCCIMGLIAGGMILGHGTVFLRELWLAAQLGALGPTIALMPVSQYFQIRGGVDYADRWRELGVLYTAVAGFLNVLVMMDAYIKIAYPHEPPGKEKA